MNRRALLPAAALLLACPLLLACHPRASAPAPPVALPAVPPADASAAPPAARDPLFDCTGRESQACLVSEGQATWPGRCQQGLCVSRRACIEACAPQHAPYLAETSMWQRLAWDDGDTPCLESAECLDERGGEMTHRLYVQAVAVEACLTDCLLPPPPEPAEELTCDSKDDCPQSDACSYFDCYAPRCDRRAHRTNLPCVTERGGQEVPGRCWSATCVTDAEWPRACAATTVRYETNWWNNRFTRVERYRAAPQDQRLSILKTIEGARRGPGRDLLRCLLQLTRASGWPPIHWDGAPRPLARMPAPEGFAPALAPQAAATHHPSTCTADPARPVTRCELDPFQHRLQHQQLPSERGEAGVCRDGLCLPRVRCAEECYGSAAEEALAWLPDLVQHCESRSTPRERIDCRLAVIAYGTPAQERMSRAFEACTTACGFPEVDYSGVPTLHGDAP